MNTSATPIVLVLGANGRFGLAAVEAFAAARWHVLAQVRREPVDAMAAGAEVLRTPLGDLAAAMAGRGPPALIVHAVNPAYPRWQREAMPALARALDLAEQFDARFMLPGNVYAYGAGMPARIDEATPRRPSTGLGRIRAAMELEIEQRAAAGRVRATIVTAGDFFGSGTGSWLDQAIARRIADGRLIYPGPTDLPHAWAYLPDLARAFVAVGAGAPEASFERYAFAGHTLTGAELLAALRRAAERLGVRPPARWRQGSMPWRLIRAGGLVVPLWRELARTEYLWHVPHAIDGARLAARFPQLTTTPIDSALEASLPGSGLLRGRTLVAAAAR